MLRRIWLLTKESVLAYVDDGAISRGAAIAYYTVTSLAPVLLIVIAIAGFFFGEDAARGAIRDQISGLMGRQSADVLQSAIRSASGGSRSAFAAIIGVATLLITASGVFGEMQTALNDIWKAKPEGGTVSRLIRARIVSLGLVGALGFLLLASLVISAAITALSDMLNQMLPFASVILHILSFLVSFVLISILFAAIYQVLPDRRLRWKDVFVGAVVTSLLFTIGKSLIGLYLGSSNMAGSYGAAGGLIILLVWVYYSA
jgi:membrane protein